MGGLERQIGEFKLALHYIDFFFFNLVKIHVAPSNFSVIILII
jgi:hypothetical protein